MTACVNKKSKRVAAVVTASLVGALSIGAPAVALAANANIDMLVADEAQDIAQGKVTAYTDQDKDAMKGTEFVVNGKAQYIVPTQLTTKTGKVIDIKDGNLSASTSRSSTPLKSGSQSTARRSTSRISPPAKSRMRAPTTSA